MGNLKSIVGDNIRRLRREHNWTQAYVAENLDITAPFLTMIESGQRGMSIDLIEKISAFFDVPPAVLFTSYTTEPEKHNAQLENLKKRLSLRISKVIDGTISELEYTDI